MHKRNRTERIASGFNFVSTGLGVLACVWFVWMLGQEDQNRIEREIGGSMEQSCVRAGDRQPFHAKQGETIPLTVKQQAMAALVDKMDESDIGARLNQSAAQHRLTWCAGNSADYYGAYTANIGILSMTQFGGPEKILNDPHTLNQALRTMYEENVHAWQDHSQNALYAPTFALPHDKITWHVTIESSARVTAFAALNQHRLNGDHAVWASNIAQSKNRHIMVKMQNAADPATGAFGPAALWAGFDAFYDMRGLVTNYQTSAGEAQPFLFGSKAVTSESFTVLGTIPGIAGNYMAGRFNADNPRYILIHDPALRDRLLRHYNDNKLNTRPLTRGAVTPQTSRVSPR